MESIALILDKPTYTKKLDALNANFLDMQETDLNSHNNSQSRLNQASSSNQSTTSEEVHLTGTM